MGSILPLNNPQKKNDPNEVLGEQLQAREKLLAEAKENREDQIDNLAYNLGQKNEAYDQTKIDRRGNIDMANANVSNVYDDKALPGFSDINPEGGMGNENAPSVHDLNRWWTEEAGRGFMRGIGQSISSTGDLINFVGALSPGLSMFDGNALGNWLNEAGEGMEEKFRSTLPEELQNENLTWGSFANPDFYSKRVAELIPLALEFVLSGMGSGKLAEMGIAKLASKMGPEALMKAVQTTKTVNRLSGLTKIDDVVGTGKGIYKLVRNVDGTGKLTEMGVSAVRNVAAGVTNNMMAGAMNAMETHKQLKAEVNADGSPKYTEEELAQIAAGTFTNNMAYMPIDMISWGVTYGDGLKNVRKMLPKNLLRSSEEVLADASIKFAAGTTPFLKAAARGAVKVAGNVMKGAGRVGRKAAFEGVEEMLQETFEEWVKLKAKASVTGEDLPSYWDFFNSDENRATKVLSFAAGGLMGGSFNIKEAINKQADGAAKYYDRTENLRSSIAANDKLGNEAREMHIQNQMFDLIYEGKQEHFSNFISSLVENQQVSPEQAMNYEKLFNRIQEDMSLANNLNVSGKEALMRTTVEANFMEGSIQRDIDKRNDTIANIMANFEEGTERETAIKDQTKMYDEAIDAKIIALSKLKANRLNLISGKLATPLDLKFVVSKTGTEHFMFSDKTFGKGFSLDIKVQDEIYAGTEEGFDMQTADGAGIVAGLSPDQFERYVQMSDEQIFEEAAKQNKRNRKGMGARAKSIYDSIKGKFLPDEDKDITAVEETEKEVEQDITPLNEEELKMKAQIESELSDESNLPVPLTDESRAVLQNQLDELNRRDAAAKAKAAEPVVASTAESDLNPTGDDSKKLADDVASGKIKENADAKKEERRSDENDFEKEAIDNPEFLDTSKKNLKQKQADDNAEAEKRFLEGDDTKIPESVENAVEDDSDFTEDEIQEVVRNLTQRALDADTEKKKGTTVDEVLEKHRGYSSEEMDKLVPGWRDEINPIKKSLKSREGKASIIGRIFRKEKPKQQSMAELEQHVSQINNAQLSAKRRIAAKTIAANPDRPVMANELYNYLDSTIARFTTSPSQIQKTIALNRRLQSMGVPVDVVAVTNMLETVGIDAMGYAVAATVFIDEKTWEQPEIYMHEMSHIYYRTMKDAPITKELIRKAQNNVALVDKLKNDYWIDVKYDMPDGIGGFIPMSMRELGVDENDNRAEQVKALSDEGIKESDMQFQDIINEELFTNYMQGPLSKHYSTFFKNTQEYGRRVENKGWWSWVKGKSVEYVQDNRDLVTALNNNEPVSIDEMQQHIMRRFSETISDKKVLTGPGMAARISKNNQAQQKALDAISEEKQAQQKAFDKTDIRRRFQESVRDRTIRQLMTQIDSNENLTERQREMAKDHALAELEEQYADNNFDQEFDQLRSIHIKGATRVLNGFIKSLNYVRRQNRLRDSNKLASDYNDDLLLDRDAMISEIYNLAYETKGDTGKFIQSIANSEVQEIDAFDKYLSKMYPKEKLAILNSMGWVMSNQRTISGVKLYKSKNGKVEIENALSEREKNKVNSQMKRLEFLASDYYSNKDGESDLDTNGVTFQNFVDAYNSIKAKTGTNADYLNVIKFLSPYGVEFSNIMKAGNISFRGQNVTIKGLVNNMVRQKVLEQGNNLYLGRARSVVEALVDTNRKFTSYSAIQNAEGNFESSKITNNHLLAEMDNMMDFLASKPSFKAFKQQFGHLNDASRRKYENPVLRSIYDNYMNGKSVPSVTQYFGLKDDQSGTRSLYKNSNDLTESMNDFMMFDSSQKTYMQNMGAFSDSPRKFYMGVNKLQFGEMFNADGSLKSKGLDQLRNSFDIYTKLNESLKGDDRNGLIESFEDYRKAFNRAVQRERQLWETYAEDLQQSASLKPFFEQRNGKWALNREGNQKLTEFVFNSSVNGLALAEIFNPGVAVKDIVKRNKGNSSPVNAIGNRNLKIEPVIVPDAYDKSITDSGMYMLRSQAEKIVRAGLGVFDLNNGLKLMNYSIDRNNPNFGNRAAYFKGYTTIIDENTVKAEPGLRGIHEMLMQREAKYDKAHFDQYGEYPSDDLLNGKPNYLNIAIPMSAIKSDFLTEAQAKQIEALTFDRMDEAVDANNQEEFDAMNEIYDGMFYSPEGNFMGISGYNFGPQQVMDKVTTDSVTPVQFISSLVVNGQSQGTLAKGEEIQRLIRREQKRQLDDVVQRLNNLNPSDYKKFILENMDLENMDQSQRLIIEESLSNLNHTAIEDFVLNTLANRLKTAGNKLKTSGTVAQQKSSIGYRLPSGYFVNGSDKIGGYIQRENGGYNPLEIVLPKHMEGKVRKREYLTVDDEQGVLKHYLKTPKLAAQYQRSTREEKLDMIKSLAQTLANSKFNRTSDPQAFGSKVADLVGTVTDKNGKILGYYVKGEMVMATRVPSHGPASTGIFEAIDFLSGEGNQTVVSNEFSKVIGSDYDGDALFIQHKSKTTPDFNKALDLTAELWTSPQMADQIRAAIDFEDKIKRIVKGNKVSEETQFPMSPEYNRNAYNNTMVSKRSIGTIFNMHRLANYLAAYNVKLNTPLRIDGKEYTGFSDGEAGTESRNNQSAQLANIILDNAKWHFADKLGLNDQTINQFALLVNMGVPMETLNKLFNSEAVKVWVKYKKNNESAYLRNKTADQIDTMMRAELGIPKGMKGTDTVTFNYAGTEVSGRAQEKANILHLMSRLEKMNSDALKLTKIMAGHKGIETNPFILEKQIAEFDKVLSNEEGSLRFGENFAENPDIKAYKENAQTVLGMMKKANKIFRTSTDEILKQLDSELAIDGLSENQLQRASDKLKKFVNSRILGYNNVPEDQKRRIRNEVFDKLYSYMDSLKSVKLGEKTAFDKSILFQKALNIYLHADKKGIDPMRSYVSVNPQFFNESLGKEEKQAVQREFEELPVELKNDLMMYDMMKNGLTGALSLVNVFDEGTNYSISNLGFYDQLNKDKKMSPEVVSRLKELLVAAEITSPDSTIPKMNFEGEFKRNFAQLAKRFNGSIFGRMQQGKPFYFTMQKEGKSATFKFEGTTDAERDFVKLVKDPAERSKMESEMINEKVKVFKPESGDIDLAVMSIADPDVVIGPYSTTRSYNYDGKADHIIEANLIEEEKKNSNSGRAYKIDYHNYNDVRELSRSEYDRVMEYNPAVSEEQRDAAYQAYKIEKALANEAAQDINQTSVVTMSDAKLRKEYEKYSEKNLYAYSIVTTPIIMEFANRASLEQSKITEKFEDGNDLGLISSWMNNNNIPSNHPATQALVRQINANYKTFVKERGTYVKKINEVTEALYKEKFGLHSNRIIATFQKIYNSVFRNRAAVYEDLYGRITETNYIKVPGQEDRKEFKLRERKDVEADYKAGRISEAEYDFYNTFREITGSLEKFGSNATRRDYVPHTAMGNFEMFSSRGILGLLVNSKEENDAIDDVKMYVQHEQERVLMPFYEIKANFNSLAASKGNKIESILEYRKMRSAAKKLLKEGKNEDGSDLQYTNMQTATAMGMGPMSRFINSRSRSAEEMPSMDLNKALIDYVHSTLFTYGNGKFEGFKEMMPLIDGVFAYNEKNGYRNAAGYVREVIKEKFINKKDQNLLGPKGDGIVNGLVKGNILYALGYKGFIVGKGLYAIGNVAIGKYMNIKREGGKAWAKGESRYWGTDEGFGIEALSRRRRAKKILDNLGFMELDLYDDVAVESKSSLDGIFSYLALLPISSTEDWIQKSYFLGMLTDEEFDKFDDNGDYKDGAEPISRERIITLEERVKNAQGKGYTPTDMSRMQTYSLGRMFLQFSRHLPTQIRERFAKDDVDMNGNKYVGSLRQLYTTASDIVNNKMSPEKFKQYYAGLKPHEKEALKAAMRGMAMMTMAGFVDASMEDSPNKLSADNVSRGIVGDANTHFDAERMSYKLIPPAMRSVTSLLYGTTDGMTENVK